MAYNGFCQLSPDKTNHSSKPVTILLIILCCLPMFPGVQSPKQSAVLQLMSHQHWEKITSCLADCAVLSDHPLALFASPVKADIAEFMIHYILHIISCVFAAHCFSPRLNVSR